MERKTFSDLKKGDSIEIRKDADKKGTVKKVNAVSHDNRFGTKVSLGDNFVFVVDRASAAMMTEHFDQRNRYLYLIAQPTKKESSDSK